MRFMMFVVTSTAPDSPSDESDVDLWVDPLDASGKRILGEVLEKPEAAATVKVRGGELIVTDGPYVESKEWICGFDILECDTLDEAIEIASRHPMARNGQLELRPFMVWE